MTIERLRASLADRYRLERELGQGGMATVYLAQDLKHDRQVAVKVLKPELAAVLGADRFVQEIKTTAALQHPHILPLFDSGTADGFLYYVMPYIEGETLRTKLDRETQLGIEEAVRITTQVADALDYAHRHGVIHRDIKPENILLHDGRPMVADFGIALAVSAAAGGRMTETGLSLGTPHYMSPEQATAEKDLTNRSDIYSLGSVLYEMLAGNPPHTGASAQQIIMKIVTDEAAPVTKLRKSVPPNVAAAVSKSIEKLPADRFASAAEFAAALGNSAFATISAKRGVASAGPPARRTAVLAVTALLAVLAALWGWLRPVPSGMGGQPWRVRIILPDSSQLAGAFSLSPDGSLLVYDGGNGLWLRTADVPDPVRIAGTDAMDGFPSISPDGRQVALVGLREITVRPVNGGTPRVAFANPTLGTMIGWSDNGHLLVPVAGGLVRVSITGGAPQPFLTLDTAAGDRFPVEVSGLPNGGAVFSIVGTDTSNIAVVGPEGGKPTRLFAGLRAVFAPPGYLIVTRADGSIVAVPFDAGHRRITGAAVSLVSGLRTGGFTTVGHAVVSATGRLIYLSAGGAFTDPRDLVWVSRSGAVALAAPGWAGLFFSVALSPDGRRAAVDEFRDDDEIIAIRDLSSGSVARVVVPLMQLNDPVFSPDGRWLYCAAQEVLRADPGGLTPPERVIAPKTQQPALAPDGSQLYYTKTIAGGTQLVRRALSSGMDVAVTPAGASSNLPRRPQVSPDGHWLAFIVTVSGRTEIHVRSTDPARSEEWPLATVAAGLAQASVRWAPAGNELYYVAHDSMMAVRVITSQTFVAGAPRALFATSGLMSRFEVARDGRFLMIRSRRDLRTPTELVMLERWTDLLPR